MIPTADALATMRSLPLVTIEAVLAQGPYLILAPHPDDESLGCGGLIAAACARGVPPVVAIVTDGAASHPGSRAYPPARLAALRRQEARAAAAHLGLPPERLVFLGLPDTASPMEGPALDAAASRIADLARTHGAATLLATWEHDPHHDHLSAHRIAARAAARTGLRHCAYPVWGWTLQGGTLPAHPGGVRIDITDHRPAKRAAIAAHRSQHAGLITDAPGGFNLPPEFLGFFDTCFETILTIQAAS